MNIWASSPHCCFLSLKFFHCQKDLICIWSLRQRFLWLTAHNLKHHTDHNHTRWKGRGRDFQRKYLCVIYRQWCNLHCGWDQYVTLSFQNHILVPFTFTVSGRFFHWNISNQPPLMRDERRGVDKNTDKLIWVSFGYSINTQRLGSTR